MSNRLEGKTAVVTGAGSGIGRAVATRFALEGAAVAALDLNAETAEETAAAIVARGGRAIGVEVDVASVAAVSAAAERVFAEFGDINILINNAGIDDSEVTLLDCTEEIWDRTINVNLKGMFLVTKTFMPSLIRSGNSAIVNTASVASIVANAGGISYTTAKAGILGFTRQVAVLHGPAVRTNAVLPGAIETAMSKAFLDSASEEMLAAIHAVPAGRHGQPDDVANLILFLASDEASFIHGAMHVVDGGWTVQ